jgi:tetratricopeptide (TPR) repeat protein
MPFIMDKKKSALWIKIFSAILAITFIGGMVVFFVSPFLGAKGTNMPVASQLDQQEQKYYDDARMYEAMVSRSSTDTTALVNLGNTYYDWGAYLAFKKKDDKGAVDKWTKAIDAYSKALKLDPENTYVKTDLGALYLYLNNPLEAKKLWNEVLSKVPTAPQALYNMGLVHKVLNETTESIKYFEEYLRLYPNDPSAQQAKKFLEELKKK